MVDKINKLVINLTFFISIFSAGLSFAQENDFAIWENIYLEKILPHKTTIHLNHEGRIKENASQFNYAYADVGITKKINKYFHFSFDYVFMEKALNTSFWSTRHQLYADVVYKYNRKSFRYYLRSMLQAQTQDIYSSESGSIPSYYLRNKIIVKYCLRRYTPYMATEFYYNLNSNSKLGKQFDRARYFAGCFYELDKANEVEIYYLFENHFNVNHSDNNYILGLGFSHTFY